VNYETPLTKQGLSGLVSPQYEVKQEMKKVQSLDFGSSDHRKGSIDAKMYRQKLLEEARKRKDEGKIDIEQGKNKQKPKKKKKKHDGHGVSSKEKASYGQCTFNMANILMVS